jgi:hypothetical protein
MHALAIPLLVESRKSDVFGAGRSGAPPVKPVTEEKLITELDSAEKLVAEKRQNASTTRARMSNLQY